MFALIGFGVFYEEDQVMQEVEVSEHTSERDATEDHHRALLGLVVCPVLPLAVLVYSETGKKTNYQRWLVRLYCKIDGVEGSEHCFICPIYEINRILCYIFINPLTVVQFLITCSMEVVAPKGLLYSGIGNIC